LGRLLLSPISAWEASLALRKAVHRPSIRDDDASAWFRAALRLGGARLVPIRQRIALEAAKVPLVYDNRDPGDCFLIATARARRVPIVTRDHAMIALSQHRPDYLAVIRC
jgi:PIN domain nuclease of toxin-antitoxin system